MGSESIGDHNTYNRARRACLNARSLRAGCVAVPPTASAMREMEPLGLGVIKATAITSALSN